MKILIISSNFPPLNSIASLRPYSWAKYWSREGHKVTVLTTEKPTTTINLNFDLSNFRLLEVPIPFIDYMRKFDDNNYHRKTNEHGYSKSHNKLVKKIILFINKFRRTRGIFLGARMPDHHDFWVIPAYRAVCREEWDLVISTHQPYANHIIAYSLKRKKKSKNWIADFRDLWVDDHLYYGLFPFTILESYLENKICKTADYLTTVSQPLADKLRIKYGNKVHVIENGYDPEDYYSLSAEPAFPPDGLRRIVYTGTIYSGKQDPSPLFEALHELYNEPYSDTKKLRVIFAGRHLQGAIDTAKKYGIADLVEYTGLVTREQALTMQRDADMLLFLEFEAPGVAGILTGKLFEYLASGTEIIGIGVTESSSVGTLVYEAKAGTMLGHDISAIKSTLKRLLTEGPRAKYVDPMIQERFNRYKLAKKMLGILDG